LENINASRIILKWIYKEVDWVLVYWLFLDQDEDKGDGSFEEVCESSGEIKGGGGGGLLD
jgi:hypothetical protein